MKDKELKLVIKNASKEFKLLEKNIKKYNTKEINDILFDVESLKNIKHNMKITNDIGYIERFLDENNNALALRNIIKYAYERAIGRGKYIVSKINLVLINLEGNIEPKLIIKEVNKLNEIYENSRYLYSISLEKFEYSKYCEISKNIEDLDSFYNKTSEYLKDFSKYLTDFIQNYSFEIEQEFSNIRNKFVELSSIIYQKKESTCSFTKTKFYLFFKKKFDDKFRKLKPTIATEKIRFKDLFKKENFNRLTLKTYFFGNDERKGILTTIFIYAFLILFGFVYLYPILYMIGYSFMSAGDLANPNVNYVPTQLEYSNYADAASTLNYWKSLGQTLLVSVLPAICQTVSCSLVAWGLARYKFKGKKILFGLVIFTFLIPSCLTMLPTVSLYAKFGITGNVMAYILPALFGQGIKSTVFILIFYQYFRSIPKAIIEAAEIDGANDFVVFLKIAIPTARSGILLTILLSIVWYYNETVLASLFFGSNIQTLPLGLENFKAAFDAMHQEGGGLGKTVNEAIYMAGTMLNILPLLLLYFFTQKYFIQGVDKAGITGE